MPDHPDGPAEPPSEAQITVVVHRGEPSPISRQARPILAIATSLIIIGAVLVGVMSAGGSSRPSGVPGAGGSFGYPFRCLSVAFAPNGAGVAHAYVMHGGLCGHYAKYASATFHRVHGSWQVVGDPYAPSAQPAVTASK